VGLALVALGSALPARAGDVDAARRTFADGVQLFRAGDYEGARTLFLKADAEHHAPAIVYNLALAEERLGHPQPAVDAYEAYIAEAGDSGEFTSSATIAIVQLKARSTRLRISTEPVGARLFVDGVPLSDPSPATLLVLAGRHVVVAQGDGWRAETDVTAAGSGDTLAVALARPAETPANAAPTVKAPPPGAPALRDSASPPAPSATVKAPTIAHPDGLMYGASFAMAPYYLLGSSAPGAPNSEPAKSVVAGPFIEVGAALNQRVAFLARGFAALGPDAKPTYAFMGGPGLSVRALPGLWLGATFLGGELETLSHDVRYGTDLVFGALVEIDIAVIDKPSGQWLASFQPGTLLTDRQSDNAAFVFPFSFGYRAF
jgi:hypothetical protein